MTADDVIAALGLQPHPEGGYFAEIHRADAPGGGRSPVTSIYYLLKEDERSHWHRIDTTEIWHFHAGAPMLLQIAEEGKAAQRHLLGAALDLGQRPQAIVPPQAWQSAEPQGHWSLVGCTVAPGFEFASFEMAPKGWVPG
ncbi:MAG: cupin domain-containing protein [Alphaproteobacteria bacterium]